MRPPAQRFCLFLSAVAATVATAAAAAPPAPADRRCIVELNRAGIAAAEVQLDEVLRCARAAARGRLAAGQAFAECVAADPSRRLAAARTTTEVAEARWCAATPAIGPDAAERVNAILEPFRGLASVFGDDVAAALSAHSGDRALAGCQVAVVGAMATIARAKLRSFEACSRTGLAAGAIQSASDLEACVAADGGERVARAVRNAGLRVAARCAGQPIAEALPGACASATASGIAACVEPWVHCDVCLGLDAADRMSARCHRFADGVATAYCGERPATAQSVARQWDEEILAAIRIDTPRPVVHARNLYHLSAAIWDAWAAYDGTADPVIHVERASASDVAAARDAAISFAAYRLLRHRFAGSPGAATALARFDRRLYELGYDRAFTSTSGGSPAALGNRIAAAVIAYGLADGANEAGGYADATYAPVNEPLVVKEPGTILADPNRWQPLALDVQIGQNGVPIPGKIQVNLGTHWRAVLPFALVRSAPGVPYVDPPGPPLLGTATDAEAKDQAVELVVKQSLLDVEDPTLIDASPAVSGNNPLGTNDGTGYPLNPITGAPYAPNVVKRQDYYRVLGMFWADGPDSETPPGHWNVVANEVSDDARFEKRLGGSGPVLDALEWDVKLYLALNGAVHDAAIAAWEQKREHDSIRPISLIRYLGGLGQSSDPSGPSYHPEGLPLLPGTIEVITPESSAPGERHAHLASFVGEVAVRGWRGEPTNPRTQVGGVGWIRSKTWIAFQRKTFVTPPFAGFVSGHSTFSRAAAEVMVRMTGSEFFPGGLGQFVAPADTFIPPEKGPTAPVALQYASYYDAADQAGISRLWSGIHIRADDLAGRRIGAVVGPAAFARALAYFDGSARP